MLFIGDIHGNAYNYLEIIKGYDESIQVGDMGVGFEPLDAMDKVWEMDMGRHMFVRGNHDNPDACRKIKNCWADFGYDERLEIFYIAGGFSIDRELRTLGLSYWKDEELSQTQGNEMLNLYDKIWPNIVVSHDCPLVLYSYVCPYSRIQAFYTPRLLEAALEIHRPKLWVFGHHHRTERKDLVGCRFIGLDSEEAVDINIEKYKVKDELPTYTESVQSN